MVKQVDILKNPLGYAKGIFCLRSVVIFCLTISSLIGLGQAKLEIVDAKANFGFVKRGEIIKNEYEIKNSGNLPLLISDIEIACSCTTVDFPKQPVVPGQKAKIVVIFNTTTVYGRQDRVVYVNSNDPKSPHKLRYKGTVSAK